MLSESDFHRYNATKQQQREHRREEVKKEQEDAPWFRYINQGNYDEKTSEAICEFLDFLGQKRFGSGSYKELIRDMNWSEEIRKYHLAKLIEYWKTGGFGYEYDNMRKELNQSFKNPQIGTKTNLNFLTDKALNEGISKEEREQHQNDELMKFLEYFVTNRLGYRSFQDYLNAVGNSAGERKEQMLLQTVDILEFWLSGTKSLIPEAREVLLRAIRNFFDGKEAYYSLDEYSDPSCSEKKFREDNK